ncbi:putative ribosomal RNA-processing protein [Planoprotostelium fungivorum]|uniref:Ribosomal RNA-processing protein 8 n=1 Tax=Planoprotostelium fungivorum TaxID=1890364 RepID=A0A2P6N4F6_9EUKA|nr:putative ribosomal RNA-processing protein [Planoprotostelium fungivorum]
MNSFEVPDWGEDAAVRETKPKETKPKEVKSKETKSKESKTKESTPKKDNNQQKNQNKKRKSTDEPTPAQSPTPAPTTPTKKKESKKQRAAKKKKVDAIAPPEEPASPPKEEDEEDVPAPSHQEGSKAKDLIDKMKDSLAGGKFRILNEQLYTTTGGTAFNMFSKDPSLFHAYHSGFASQVERWPSNPVDYFISYIKLCPKNKVIADFGCGEAKLSASVPHKVHSFDLVAVNDRVTACNMAQVPLKNSTVDIAIFSLSLMGTDYIKFLSEAHRVLKIGGELKIAEVKSRIENVSNFVEELRKMGFNPTHKDETNTMFVLLDFIKSDRRPNNNVNYVLKPCRYKKR